MAPLPAQARVGRCSLSRRAAPDARRPQRAGAARARWSGRSAPSAASPSTSAGCTTSTPSTRRTSSTCTWTSRASSCARASRCSRSTAPSWWPRSRSTCWPCGPRSSSGPAALPAVARGGVDLLEAARQRLLFWDIRPPTSSALERTGEVRRTLDLYSPVSGYVVQKIAYHGMRVTPADTLFDIADLSHLWVLADVYESDLPAVRDRHAGGADRLLPAGPHLARPCHQRRAHRRREDAHRQGARRGRQRATGSSSRRCSRTWRCGPPAGSGLVVPDERGRARRASGSSSSSSARTAPRAAGGAAGRQGRGAAWQVLRGPAARASAWSTPANFLLDSESSLTHGAAMRRRLAAAPGTAH